MAALWDELGLDGDRLKRQATFLVGRAEHHDAQTIAIDRGKQQQLHLACAATLRRDAAAISLLLGETKRARSLLNMAGRQYAELGSYFGYFLLRLARPQVDMSELTTLDELNEVELSLRDAVAGADASEPKVSRRRASLRESGNSPDELLHLFQAVGNTKSSSERGQRISNFVSRRLSATPNVLVSNIQIPIRTYLDLFYALSAGDIAPNVRDNLFALSIRRAEFVSVARADTYHWKRLLKPAALVDFDLVALGIAALVAGPHPGETAKGIAGERGLGARLPFDIAKELFEAS